MSELYLEIIKISIIAIYIIWSFAFSINALLILYNNEGAIEWARRFYSKKVFTIEAYLFFPAIYIFWLLFELLPALIGLSSEVVRFNLQKIIDIVFP